LGKRSLDYYFGSLEHSFTLLGHDLLAIDVERNLAQGFEMVMRFKREHPDLVNVNLVRPNGELLITSEMGYGKGLPFLGNSASFAQAREDLMRGQTLNIGRTLLGPVAGKWVIPLRFGVRDEKGRLAYILAGVLPLDTQQAFWRNIPLPPNAALELVRDDGYLVSRFPGPDKSRFKTLYGVKQTGYLVDSLRTGRFPASGGLEGHGRAADKTYLWVFNRLERHPITFAVSVPLTNPLARWWDQVKPLYLFVAVLFGGVLFVYLWMVRRQLATERESELAEQKLSLAAQAMENTIEGIVITDAENRVVSVNKAFTEITGYASEEVLGLNPSFLNSGHHDRAFFEALWRSLMTHGRWEGEITNRRKNGETYTELLSISVIRGEDGLISHYVGVFNDISQSKHYEERLEFLAHHDPLTNLPNRALLHDRLDEAIGRAARNDSLVFVLFMDLDRFKIINDSLGHEMGDRLLRVVADRLRDAVRASDTVARLGGDEFTVLLERVRDTDEAALLAQKLLDALAVPVVIEEHQLFTSASIGISCFPRDGNDAATLLKHADTALYRAKEERNKFKFFSGVMNEQAREFMAMATRLHSALDKNEIYLEYQPRIDLVTGCISGVEALARWHQPELGFVPPDKFIPVAEETGLIASIGDWVLREACRQGRRWQDQGYPLRMGVNLSTRQFRKPEFAEAFLQTVAESGFDPGLLEVEITETLMMHDPGSTKQILDELARHGVRIAIDDFGTGYSSLYYLRSFPIHYVKIDRSFMNDVPHDADNVEIVRTIIAMAKNLRLALIAEGVETADQLAMLMAESCDEVQGFLLSPPLPPAAIPDLIKRYCEDRSHVEVAERLALLAGRTAAHGGASPGALSNPTAPDVPPRVARPCP
jgi:diguanylate cyclase (GGDEF)-like protein/PAS domain S-box-containing protein